MEGALCKWTNMVKGWQYRYCVLDSNQALLSYYTSKEKMIKGDRRGCVRLKGAVVGISDEDERFFSVTVDNKMFHFQANDAEDMKKWVAALEDTISRHTQRKKIKKNDNVRLPTFNDFEKKLIETDAYLKLLIEQVENLNKLINNCEDEATKEKLVDIEAKTSRLLEGVKHTIMLLQISKNTLIQVNGEKLFTETATKKVDKNKSEFYVDYKPAKDSRSSSISTHSINQEVLSSSPSKATSSKKLTPIMTVKAITLNRDTSVDSIRETLEATSINEIPEMSYSSDEDEFFYDASEETPSGTIIIDPIINSIENKNSIIKVKDENEKLVKNINDYDALYEDADDEDDLGSLEGHGSVISHLISQVKIGMDLTKVVLPTFILERRSLLEMYADFFAHPDLFVSIADYNTPEERFIQMVRWYLSAFHAGRKSSVAKKPYNPVLGEMFKCYWNLPEQTSKNDSNSLNIPVDSPVPWAPKNSLTFVAEQVSHHPPISAFYAEHREKRIMCTAHIYTKSKFLGLSIGVHNLGEGSVHLLDRGEVYTCTFPSAYGRSILTVPWVELGGTIVINCPQTGFSANIEFLTKPLFGGKKNKITAEIFNPSKKSIMSIDGDWNGLMHCRKNNGPQEMFVDTKSMEIIKKQVKPISEQEDYESRRLWKDVTAALKLQDVQAATNSKFTIEEKQRELVKQRQEINQKWENRVFQSVGERWLYKNPLTKFVNHKS